MKKIVIYILVVVLLIMTTLLFTINNTTEINGKEENEKITLKLNHFINEDLEKDNIINKNSIFIKLPSLKETSYKIYENEKELKVFIDYIRDNLKIDIDNKWKYLIHFYNENETVGMLEFIYTIKEIDTNKVIIFYFDEGFSNEVYYKCLDEVVNEENLLKRLKTFKDTHVQEKLNFKKDEKLVEERTKYIYYYNAKKLVYSYVVYVSQGELNATIIDNGSEYFIN